MSLCSEYSQIAGNPTRAKGARNSGLALASLAIVLSACLAYDGRLELEWDQFVERQPQAFAARIAWTTGDEATIELSGPVKIPARNAGTASVFKLWYRETAKFGPAWEKTWYLDANLRVAAVQIHCGFGLSDCANDTRWEWTETYDLPPFGYAGPYHARAGQLFAVEGDHVQLVPWTSHTHRNGTLEMRMEFLAGVRDYWYYPHRPLPDGPGYHVAEFRLDGPLDQAGVFRGKPPTNQARGWFGVMFPEENVDHFALGVTHIDIVRAAEPAIGKRRDTCVRLYSLRILPEPRPGPLPSFDERTIAYADLHLIKGDSLFSKRVSVIRERGHQTTRLEVSSGPSALSTVACDDLYQSPWPALPLSAGIQRADGLQIAKVGFWGFEHNAGLALSKGRPPTAGWHAWTFFYDPPKIAGRDSVAYEPYFVRLDPTSDQLFLVAVFGEKGDTFWD